MARRLAAYRDVPAVPTRRALSASSLVKLAQLSADLPEVRELDINPAARRCQTGVLALDARVMIGPAPERRGGTGAGTRASPSAPIRWNGSAHLVLKGRSGSPCARCGQKMRGLFKSLLRAGWSAEDLRLRFFMPVRDFNHAFLARLTQLDYARAIAFVAAEIDPDGTERMLGAVRLHADGNHDSGEFAISVGRHARGTGLAYALMRLMIDWARFEGIGRIEGTVLAENRAMLAVCRRLGFSQGRDPEDQGVMKVRLELAVE